MALMIIFYGILKRIKITFFNVSALLHFNFTKLWIFNLYLRQIAQASNLKETVFYSVSVFCAYIFTLFFYAHIHLKLS